MKNLILVCALFLCGSVAVNAQDAAKTGTTGAASMKFDEVEYNYGTIKQGDVVEHKFTFTSTGKEPLVISQAQGSCGCTVPEWPKEAIKKGEKGVIKVTFNSAGKMGPQDKTVTLMSNASDSPMVLHIKGTVEAPAPKPAAPAEAKPMEAPKN